MNDLEGVQTELGKENCVTASFIKPIIKKIRSKIPDIGKKALSIQGVFRFREHVSTSFLDLEKTYETEAMSAIARLDAKIYTSEPTADSSSITNPQRPLPNVKRSLFHDFLGDGDILPYIPNTINDELRVFTQQTKMFLSDDSLLW